MEEMSTNNVIIYIYRPGSEVKRWRSVNQKNTKLHVQYLDIVHFNMQLSKEG